MDDSLTLLIELKKQKRGKLANMMNNNMNFEQLEKDLNSDDVEKRKSAIIALGEMKDNRAVDLLLGIIGNQFELYEIVTVALRALKNTDDKRIIAPVLRAYSTFDSDIVKMYVASILGGFEDPDVVDPLIKILKFGPQGAKCNAAYGLGINCYVPAVNALFEAFNSERNQVVRRSILSALGMVEDIGVVSTLIKALKDSDQFIREIAAESLGDLSEKNARVAGAAKDAISDLQEMLDDSYSNAKINAAITLIKLGDESGKNVFIKAITSDDRENYLTALRKIDSPKFSFAKKELEKLTKSNNDEISELSKKSLAFLSE
jgi:HEAT repeat protein